MKKRLFFIIALSLIILSLVVIDTYGLFEAEGSASNNLSVGNWEIVLNGEDVTLEQAITIDDFTYTNNSHTESGYFAPGSSANLDVIIDASNSNVAMSYTISIDSSAFDDYPNIHLAVTDLSTNQVISGDTITGQILLNSVSKQVRLRFSLVWEDDEDYDVSDTYLIDSSLSILVNASFSQLFEE